MPFLKKDELTMRGNTSFLNNWYLPRDLNGLNF